MLGILWGAINYVRLLFGLIFPLFTKATDFAKWGRWAWHTMHTIVIVGIVVILYLVFYRWSPSVQQWLELHLTGHNWLAPHFMPLIFLLMYAIGWVLRWIWLLLGPEAEIDQYPDITRAFSEGLAKLSEKGINPTDLPLFLILGRTKAGDEFLFQAAGIQLEAYGPMSSEAPVRVWATRDAIYVTAPVASALARYADLLIGGGDQNLIAANAGSNPAAKTIGVDMETEDPIQQRVQELMSLARFRDHTADEKAELRDLARKANQRPARVKPVLPADAAHLARKRLRYLCQLLGKVRKPFCPANGLMVILNWESLETDSTVQSAALALRTDLEAARSGLRLCCPAIALVGDMDEARGFEELLRSFQPSELQGKIGKGLPMVPDLPVGEQPEMYDRFGQWLGDKLLPYYSYRACQIDGDDSRGTSARNVFNFYRQVYERMPRLGRALRGGLPLPTGAVDGLEGPLLFAGCYLAGTGRSPHLQAFVPGVFGTLTKHQGVVAWSAAARRDNERYRRMATVGYAFLAVILGVIVVCGVVLWKRGG